MALCPLIPTPTCSRNGIKKKCPINFTPELEYSITLDFFHILPYCVSLFLYEHEVDIAISRSTYLSRDEDKRGLLIKWNGAVTKDFHIIPTISSYKLPTLQLRKTSCKACEIRMEIKKETWNYWSFLILISDYQFLLIVQDKENGVYLCLLSLSTSLIFFEATTMLLLGCQSDVQPESGQHQIRGDYVTLSRSWPKKIHLGLYK